MTSKYTILGDQWTVKVLKRLPKEWHENDQGVTYPGQKLIVIRKSAFSLGVLLHELTHAYHNYLCLETTTEMTANDFEEIYCEVMAKYGIKIVNDALIILLRVVKNDTTAITDSDRDLLKDLLNLETSLDAIMERLHEGT
jgi:hypothetical protein